MAIIWFSQKWWPWPCPSSDCQKKKFCIVACPEDIFCKRKQDDRTSGAACRAFEDRQTNTTDKQTDTHTDRGDQYTLRKVFRKVIRGAIIGYFSYYIDFNWPWPLTLTFDLDLDLHLYCKKKRNVVTSREAKRRLAYKNGNYLPIGISSRINLQPTRSLYHFRFKSYGPLCDFHWFLFKVTWHKNVTSYVKTDGRLQNRRSIRNICQPTRSLYHFRFKSYDPLCDFH